MLGVPFYVMRFLDGHVITQRAAGRARDAERAARARPRPRRHARRDPRRRRRRARRSPRSRARAATSSGRCGGSRSCGRSTRRASCPTVDEVGALPRRARPRAAGADGRPRRLPPREHDGRPRRADAHRSRCSTGRWARSATRAPTSATCSRPTASRAAASSALGSSPVTARAGLPLARRARRALRRAERPRRRAARVVRGARALEGGSLLRGDLRPLHPRRARRRGHARRDFEMAVPLLAETALDAIG